MPLIEAADRTSIHFWDWGSGTPVVLLHGWPLNADMWEYQAMALTMAGYRVIAPDRRGFGRSGKPWTGYDYDTFADDLAALMERLDLRDAALVGFSMGGGEVARYLARHGGSRVARVALVAAVTPFLLKAEDNPDGVDATAFDTMAEALLYDRPGFLESFCGEFFGVGVLSHPVSDAILRWAQGMALTASPKATLDCVRAFSETDFRPDMAAFSMPTLIVHGDADTIVPIDVSARQAAEMIAGAELKEYEGAPHGLCITHQDELNEDLLDFLGG